MSDADMAWLLSEARRYLSGTVLVTAAGVLSHRWHVSSADGEFFVKQWPVHQRNEVAVRDSFLCAACGCRMVGAVDMLRMSVVGRDAKGMNRLRETCQMCGSCDIVHVLINLRDDIECRERTFAIGDPTIEHGALAPEVVVAEMKATLEATRVVGLCRDCKHWDRDGLPPAVPMVEIVAVCNAVRHYEDKPEQGQPDYRDVAYVSDASGYSASLNTRGDFGCVLFEQREPESEAAQAKV